MAEHKKAFALHHVWKWLGKFLRKYSQMSKRCGGICVAFVNVNCLAVLACKPLIAENTKLAPRRLNHLAGHARKLSNRPGLITSSTYQEICPFIHTPPFAAQLQPENASAPNTRVRRRRDTNHSRMTRLKRFQITALIKVARYEPVRSKIAPDIHP